MKPFIYACTTCGSKEVSLEGFIVWDEVYQEFQVDGLCDKGHYCNDCDGECRVEARDMTDEEIAQCDDVRAAP